MSLKDRGLCCSVEKLSVYSQLLERLYAFVIFEVLIHVTVTTTIFWDLPWRWK